MSGNQLVMLWFVARDKKVAIDIAKSKNRRWYRSLGRELYDIAAAKAYTRHASRKAAGEGSTMKSDIFTCRTETCICHIQRKASLSGVPNEDLPGRSVELQVLPRRSVELQNAKDYTT